MTVRSALPVGVMAALAALGAAATPTPTPTVRRLSGGFGRGAPDAVVTPSAAPATPAVRQSLAESVSAAKKRKETKARIAITNETLVTDPKKGRLTTSSPRPTAPPSPAAREDVQPAPPERAEEAEAYWRDRMRTARERVQDLRERVRRLEGEAKKLENDFYSWDDGQYRDGVIKPAWDRKREELDTTRDALEKAEKDLADLPEKARKAGALPGWLRE